MRKHLLLGLALSSALAAGTAAAAPGFDGGFGGPHGHRHGILMGMHKLNLTDAQKASIKQLVKTSFEQHKGQFKALMQQRRAFESLTPDDAGYQAAATRLAQAEANATEQRVERRAALRAQVYALLTPAQKSQLAALKAQREQRMQAWKQFREQQRANASSANAATP